jgi:hypothetical protein
MLFAKLFSYMSSGFAVGACTQLLADDPREEQRAKYAEARAKGLQCAHAYGIMDVTTVTVRKEKKRAAAMATTAAAGGSCSGNAEEDDDEAMLARAMEMSRDGMEDDDEEAMLARAMAMSQETPAQTAEEPKVIVEDEDEDEEVCLVKLRNPNAGGLGLDATSEGWHGGWTGAWSHGSSLWTWKLKQELGKRRLVVVVDTVAGVVVSVPCTACFLQP